MDPDDFARQVTEGLRDNHAIACDIGTFFLRHEPGYIARNPMTGAEIPARAQRFPMFVPADRLLSRLPDSSLKEADYRAYVAQDHFGDIDLVTGALVMSDPLDWKTPVVVPAATRSLEMKSLFDTVVKAIVSKGAFTISGFGSVERRKVVRSTIVVFEFSQTLKYAVDPD